MKNKSCKKTQTQTRQEPHPKTEIPGSSLANLSTSENMKGDAVAVADQHASKSANKKGSKMPEIRWTDKLIALATIVIAAATVIQGYELVTGSGDTHKLADSTNAVARAWVVVRATKFGYLNDASGKAVVSSIVELANTGPSPAFNVRGWRCAQVLSHEPSINSEPKDLPDCVEDDIGMIGKDIPTTMHVNDLTQTVPQNSLSRDTHDQSGKHFYAWGYFTYDVVSKDRRHFVSFCLLNAGDQLGSCPHGNDGD